MSSIEPIIEIFQSLTSDNLWNIKEGDIQNY